MKLRRLITLGCLAVSAVVLWGAAPAAAAPIWNLDIHHNETDFPPGGTAEYWFDVSNVGDANTSGPVTLTVDLPTGLTRQAVRGNNNGFKNQVSWSCPGTEGDSMVTCTTSEVVAHHELSSYLVLSVNVSPSASGNLLTTAEVEGGGAVNSASAIEPTQVSSVPASFGILASSFKAGFFEEDGTTPVFEAGGHPDLAAFSFDFNSVADPKPAQPPIPAIPYNKAPAGTLRDLAAELPPGFIGNPSAVGECTPAQLTGGVCPASSQVGRIDVNTQPISIRPESTYTTFSLPVFNMRHPRGVVADLAFQLDKNPIHLRASLDPARGYAIDTSVVDANESLPVFNQKLTLWGVPADPSHDFERCSQFSFDQEIEGVNVPRYSKACSAGVPRKAFLTLPSRCGSAESVKLTRYDSWQNPGVFGPDLEAQLPPLSENCDAALQEPAISAQPTSQDANSPTGLDVHLKVPQNESPDSPATPPVKKVKVTLPEGMTVSPSFAMGLGGCSEQEIGLGTNDPVGCPESSRIGELSIKTPLLPESVEGSVYMANQTANPFGSAFALYMVLQDTEERGVLVKLPGRLDLDQSTGRITTTFDDLPQLPFEEVSLKFRGGDLAPLVNASTCGPQQITAELSTWAQPDAPQQIGDSYDVSHGAEGSACPSVLTGRPFSPKLKAGTQSPKAGSFSPFVMRVTRGDAEQEIGRLNTALPPGLTARIAGVPYCPEAAIASISTAEGTGAAELHQPACPVASQVGTVDVGIGSGGLPNFFPGKVYLAGAYEGAPLSLVVVVPALTGPFDFGSVVVRAAVEVDPTTARVTAVSDALPTIVHGVPVRLRDLRLRLDHPHMTLNPTSCDPMAVGLTAVSAGGATATPSSRFQVGGCGHLKFGPKLSLKLKGGMGRGAYPALRAVLKARRGDANIKRVSVALPHSEFLAQEHIGTICTRVRFAAHDCPKRSIYGYAKAWSPLLDEPLQGPVYLRSSNHLLPDLVAALHGQIDIELSGRIDSIHEGMRTTFGTVPDAPVSKFVLKMKGGKQGLLRNSRNICLYPGSAWVSMSAHNGRGHDFAAPLHGDCGKR
jgi:hypothetical protein